MKPVNFPPPFLRSQSDGLSVLPLGYIHLSWSNNETFLVRLRSHGYITTERNSSVVRALESLLKGNRRVRIPVGAAGEFSSPGSTFCADSYFGTRSHPRVTAVARKRYWSFCRKCRWQVTAEHAHTLRMRLCMKRHGAWLYGVHTTCAETAAVWCGTSRASTPLRWIFKNAL